MEYTHFPPYYQKPFFAPAILFNKFTFYQLVFNELVKCGLLKKNYRGENKFPYVCLIAYIPLNRKRGVKSVFLKFYEMGSGHKLQRKRESNSYSLHEKRSIRNYFTPSSSTWDKKVINW